MLVNSYPRLHKVSFNCKRELFDYNGRRKFSVAIVALRSCGGGREGHFVTFIIHMVARGSSSKADVDDSENVL